MSLTTHSKKITNDERLLIVARGRLKSFAAETYKNDYFVLTTHAALEDSSSGEHEITMRSREWIT